MSRGNKGMEGDDRKLFTVNQMSEMIRNHAFSSGCHSYKQFARKAEPRRSSPRAESLVQLGRPRNASNFGIELFTEREARAWEGNMQGLGRRSSSEGALLKYATRTVDDMTRSVREQLGVDVSATTRREMNKPSFLARLDIGGVSINPSNPASATGQAVRKVCGKDNVRQVSLSLLREGQQGGSSGSRASSGRPKRYEKGRVPGRL